MKQIITKEEVSAAIEQLTAQGKRPTLAAIHAFLNHRGSMSTLVRLKAELQGAGTASVADSPEGLRSFREMWELAVAQGRREHEAVIAELRENLTSVAGENERLEGRIAAAEKKVEDLEHAKSLIEVEFRDYRSHVKAEVEGARAATIEAAANASDALARLAERQADHRKQTATLQSERDEAMKKAHEIEIRLVRALALLEVTDRSACGQVWLNHNS